MKHCAINELRMLAYSYTKEKVLDDKQLNIKRHIAGCDECYEAFCTEYLIIKNLFDSSMITEDVFEKEDSFETLREKFMLRIKRVKDKLDIRTRPDMAGDDKWEFFQVPQLAVARSAQTDKTKNICTQYVTAFSQYTHIDYDGKNIVIQFDDDYYQVAQLTLLVNDGDKVEQFKFQYDKESECYKIVIDSSKYSENMMVEIIEDTDE